MDDQSSLDDRKTRWPSGQQAGFASVLLLVAHNVFFWGASVVHKCITIPSDEQTFAEPKSVDFSKEAFVGHIAVYPEGVFICPHCLDVFRRKNQTFVCSPHGSVGATRLYDFSSKGNWKLTFVFWLLWQRFYADNFQSLSLRDSGGTAVVRGLDIHFADQTQCRGSQADRVGGSRQQSERVGMDSRHPQCCHKRLKCANSN